MIEPAGFGELIMQVSPILSTCMNEKNLVRASQPVFVFFPTRIPCIKGSPHDGHPPWTDTVHPGDPRRDNGTVIKGFEHTPPGIPGI